VEENTLLSKLIHYWALL